MSRKELASLMSGFPLINRRDHSQGGKTNSKGFCFTAQDPEIAINWLKGIVDVDVCVTMNFKDPEKLKESWGQYALPGQGKYLEKIIEGEYPPATKRVIEYCCEEYSLSDITILDIDNRYANMYPNGSMIKEILKQFNKAGR